MILASIIISKHPERKKGIAKSPHYTKSVNYFLLYHFSPQAVQTAFIDLTLIKKPPFRSKDTVKYTNIFSIWFTHTLRIDPFEHHSSTTSARWPERSLPTSPPSLHLPSCVISDFTWHFSHPTICTIHGGLLRHRHGKTGAEGDRTRRRIIPIEGDSRKEVTQGRRLAVQGQTSRDASGSV